MPLYEIGQVAVITHTIEVNDEETDPSTVMLDIDSPSGVRTHVEYAGGAGLIARDAEGVYSYAAEPDEAGRWWFKWWATGTAKEARQDCFDVKRPMVIPA